MLHCREHGELLFDAIASVERHVEEPCELLVIDEGSRQVSTQRVLSVLRDAGYRVETEDKPGSAAARNRGVALARGPYVLLLDADCRLLPGFVSRAVATLEARPGVGVVLGMGVEVGRRSTEEKVPLFDPCELAPDDFVDTCAVWRREVWQEVGGFDPALEASGWENWDLWLGSAERGWAAERLVAAYECPLRPAPTPALADSGPRPDGLRYLAAKHGAASGRLIPELVLGVERSAGDSLRAQHARERVSCAIGALQALQETLRAELGRLARELDQSRQRSHSREAELVAIQRSKMWRLWMVYHRLRRAVLAPFAAVGWAAIRFGARSLELLKKWLGLLYLIGWVATAWIAAFGRGFRRAGTGRSTAPVEPLASGSLGRRPRILVVSPYQLHPADHGGGVRIFNLVRQLSRHCDLQLLIFSPRDDDPQQREVLAPLVEKVYFHHWRPGFKPDPWGLKPKGVQLFEAGEVRAKVVEILARERIDILQLEYTEMGQYGLPRFARVKVVLTEIDITFRARARRRRAGMHRRYVLDQIFGTSWTDSLRQLRYELQVARRADQVHVMSQTDGDYLARFLPSGWRTLRVIPNAVDGGYYLPSAPGQRLTRRLLFLGNFDHLPNLDALDYLLERIWPRVRERVPDASLWVVGARADSVRHYDGREGVVVVGAVPETKPFYQQCRALLAPIRAGSGTRLKILEALACATPVVTTTVGAEGIAGAPGEHFLIADDEASFAELTCRVLTDGELCARLGRAGRQLIETGYSWERSSAVALAAYQELCPQTASAPIRDRRAAPPVEKSTARRKQVDVSVIIPTLNGGVLLERCLAAVRRQRTARSVEIFCVDSGSPRADLAVMKRYDANVHPIDRSEFNHGLTRDLGASRSRGRALVFLSQDAVPRDDEWLERLVAPLFDNGSWAAVQGAIAEVPDPRRRFYWASCGARFYFTRESKRWIESYFGIGFSTVNAAIRRDVWQQHPFGPAAIMEDKKWQRDVVAAGLTIVEAPEAVVHHTHDYSLRSLLNRCYSEGIGWREAGERYSLGDMLADLWQPGMAVDLLRGFRAREVRSWAEVLFPWLRPVMLFRGSQWGRSVRL